MIDLILLLAVPIVLSLTTAFVLGRTLKRHWRMVPARVRFMFANLAPVIVTIMYFWVFDQIDFALHRANGGSDEYMGPMVVLVYGFPIFALLFVASFFVASYRFAES